MAISAMTWVVESFILNIVLVLIGTCGVVVLILSWLVLLGRSEVSLGVLSDLGCKIIIAVEASKIHKLERIKAGQESMG